MSRPKDILKSSALCGVLLFLFASSTCTEQEAYLLEIPEGFPEMDIPEDNALTAERVALGEMMFFDPILSVDTSISCGTCHKPEFAFADTVALSIGVHGQSGMRNTPTLLNVGFQPSLMRDGGVPTLEMQVLAPVGDLSEMGFNMRLLVERLENHPTYGPLMERAYGRKDAFAITRALAAYQRSLIDGRVPESLSASAQRGQKVFELHCNSCHSGPDYTTNEIVNIGLRMVYSPDSGRARITRKVEDSGKFRTPGLRNVSLTPPYMHDGSIATLKEVVEFFNSGGVGHPNQDARIVPLNLTEEQKGDLVAYLMEL